MKFHFLLFPWKTNSETGSKVLNVYSGPAAQTVAQQASCLLSSVSLQFPLLSSEQRDRCSSEARPRSQTLLKVSPDLNLRKRKSLTNIVKFLIDIKGGISFPFFFFPPLHFCCLYRQGKKKRGKNVIGVGSTWSRPKSVAPLRKKKKKSVPVVS